MTRPRVSTSAFLLAVSVATAATADEGARSLDGYGELGLSVHVSWDPPATKANSCGAVLTGGGLLRRRSFGLHFGLS